MAKRTGAVTIRDVARAADVSIGTASRVINNKSTVREEIRVRVKEAIQRLGYRPNAIAQSMRRQSTQMIGCVIREINIPSLASFVRAANDVLETAGFSLLLTNSDGLREREQELLSRLNAQQMDGVMLSAYSPVDEEFEAFLRGLRLPIVMFDRDEPDWIDTVLVDHENALHEATTHLLRLGHRRIGLLTGGDRLFPSRERIRGYRRAFAEFDLPVDEELLRPIGFRSVDGYRNATMLAELRDPPTAIISGALEMLPGVLKALRDKKLVVPDDMSLIATGDSELAELCTPAVSVVRWNQSELGRAAARLLLKRIRDGFEAPAQRVMLPAEYLQRGSVAPPRG